LRVGRLSINELVAIAVLAAFASGDYKTAGVVAFFMLTGELIETRTAEGARTSIESLIKLTPTKARRIKKDGSEEEVAASELAVGDVIRIRPGDNVAADGVIVSGQGSFNQATITGESLPVDKKTGDEVFAGTQNLTGVSGNQGQPRRRRHDAGPRARTDSRRRKNQAAHHENRGPIHGLLHAAGAGHRRARLGVHA
jgi:cation transport ATPase